jgi:hypothetical protein
MGFLKLKTFRELSNKKNSFAVVITSISSPNNALKSIGKGCLKNNNSFSVIGDVKSPPNFSLKGCKFFSLEDQKKLPFKLASKCPANHYTRKNLGYLLAIKEGNEIIVETDDDNIPTGNFWIDRQRFQTAHFIENSGWINVYKYFSQNNIWPRGFPLEFIKNSPSHQTQYPEIKDCPIQQGLADTNPDVDAIYRMTMELPILFDKRASIALGNNTWCPFNSQNTTWFRDAFPLLYLPSYCNFRMTDIWRSFVAQRICWTCGWHVSFHNATVYQERNEHNLLRDFHDEIPGYLNNGILCATLQELDLKQGTSYIFDNLRICYEKMIKCKWITDERELILLDSWIDDLITLGF